MREKMPRHDNDKDNFAKQAARFWNVFQKWAKGEWVVEPDEDNPGRWVVWNPENHDEIANGNSPFQALESAIQRTKRRTNGKRQKATNGK